MSVISDAIFFFSGQQIVKQMLYSEFDALLDGVVEASEFKAQRVNAVFLQIDTQLKIRGLVCFYLSFTDEGFVTNDWNIPLQQLLQSAHMGPDLGAGKIRLVCHSQCSVPWHQQSLWDPSAEQLKLLIKAVENNKLSLLRSPVLSANNSQTSVSVEDVPIVTAEPPVVDASKIPTLEQKQVVPTESSVSNKNVDMHDDSAAIHALKSAYVIKMDRLQKAYDDLSESHLNTVNALKAKAKQQVKDIGADFQTDAEKLRQEISTLKQRLESEQLRYSELKEHQVESAANSQLEREQLLSKLEDNEEIGSEKIMQLQQAFKKELDARLETEITKVNDALAIREVELFYRDEQLAVLRDDIRKYKKAKQNTLMDSGHQILTSLEDSGVTLVAYQEGVGHITIASEDVGRYLEQKEAYLAERCQVSVDVFKAWQAHYENAVCLHEDGDLRCNKPVPRVELVSSFEEGVSDRCSQHIV